MQAYAPCGCKARGRPPRGGRGLKSKQIHICGDCSGRPPRGGRGLKYVLYLLIPPCNGVSPPSRGAWIEIMGLLDSAVDIHESPPSRGAWIEISTP